MSSFPLEKSLLSARYSRVCQGPDDVSVILRACLHQLEPQHYLGLNCVFPWLTIVPKGTSICQAEVTQVMPQPHT